MRYKVGDKVTIRKDLVVKRYYCQNNTGFNVLFVKDMKKFLGRTATIVKVSNYTYSIDIDNGLWFWTDEMLENADDSWE